MGTLKNSIEFIMKKRADRKRKRIAKLTRESTKPFAEFVQAINDKNILVKDIKNE